MMLGAVLVRGLDERLLGSSIAVSVVMSDTILAVSINGHYACCEMFPMEWSPTGSEDRCSAGGILLEIWQTGGLVHSALPIAEDSLIEFGGKSHTIQALVASCEPDEHYGFLVQVTVNPRQYDKWLPEFCLPAYLQLSRLDYLGP
jgi:hypothetical protein